MEHSETKEGQMDTDGFDNNEKLKRKLMYVLKYIDNEDRKKFRHDLAKAISECDDGKELSIIFKMYRIDDDNLQSNYLRVHSSLQQVLAKIENYYIEPYESVVNGLSLKKNYIELSICCLTSQPDPNMKSNLIKELNLSQQFSKVVPFKTFEKIECVHIDTGCSVEIDLSEPYDLHNSEFINQLKQADNKINELMAFLKIWFKNIHIYSNKSMTKYCLMTLVIFYLQNTNPPVLASIKTIQQTAQKSIINGINFGLNSRCIPMNFTQNIHQMIKGFFEFYSSLDFEKVIIAPYLGKAIKKADFENKVFEYPEYEAQMKVLAASSGKPAEELETDHPICVQDMFYLNRNIAIGKNYKTLSNINFEYLKICITMAHKKCCDPNISTKNLYKSLLLNIIEDFGQMFNTDDSIIKTFDIIPLDNELKSLAKFADQPLKLRKLWTKAYIAAIPQIITTVYKIAMTLVPRPTGKFTIKKFDETEELPLPFRWSISSSVDLWTGREMPRSSATFMEYQLAQTEKLYAERRHKSEFAVQFKGFITIAIAENFNALHIEANSNEAVNKKNDLLKFFGSLKWYMRTYNLRYRIHLLESQLQANN